METLDKLKLRIGEDSEGQELLLEQLLEDAEYEILDFCNRSKLTPRLEPLKRELAIIYFNRQGTEGETSHSEGGMSVSYSTDIPENIKKRLKAHRLLKGAMISNATK